MDLLMLHDLRREHFDLPLERYRLTFDDGLFSHYYYHPLLATHSRPLTFFITTAFIRQGAARPVFAERYLEAQDAAAYMRRALVGSDFSCFMTVEEVQYLAAQPNVRIGAHSHFNDVILTDVHPRKPRPASPWRLERFAQVPAALLKTMSIRSRLAFRGQEFSDGRLVPRAEAQWEDYIKRDTELCLNWFARHLNLQPDAYGFPFNEYSPKLIAVLKTFGFREFCAGSSVRHSVVIGRVDAEDLLAARGTRREAEG
jgi:peptidoglycan/xylan/chitin deacetylase (PgdA/CDA1 family)